MTFGDEAWAATTDTREAIDALPFLRALESGTLERSTFLYYLAQDAHYLARYSESLAAAGNLATDPADRDFWLASASSAIAVEAALHGHHLADHPAIPVSAACLDYTSFLAARARDERYAVLAAALLPCFWVYEDVGRRLLERVGSGDGHPYGDWIATYADPVFATASATARAIVDAAADAADESTRVLMLAAFVEATGHELRFWDAAWRDPLRKG